MRWETDRTEGITRSFVNGILRLTLLAPDIQETILEGKQPKGSLLEELRDAIPSELEKQRKALSQVPAKRMEVGRFSPPRLDSKRWYPTPQLWTEHRMWLWPATIAGGLITNGQAQSCHGRVYAEMTTAMLQAQTLIMLVVLAVPVYGQDFDPISLQAKDATIRLTVTGTYRGGMYSKNTPASPPGYDAKSKRLFIGSWDRQDIDVLDISDPYLPKKMDSIDLTAYGNRPYGLAVKHDLVAVTVREILDRTDSARPGNLVIFNTSASPTLFR